MLRIGRGIWRSQILRPDLKGVRPTPSRVREAIMSIIHDSIPGATVWDLFSGSGAFGIECISCGAANVTFVDISSRNLLLISRFLKERRKQGEFTFKTVKGKLPGAIEKLDPPADVIFLDPPYDSPFIYSWIKENCWEEHLNPGGVVLVESGGEEFISPWSTRSYGDTYLHIRKV